MTGGARQQTWVWWPIPDHWLNSHSSSRENPAILIAMLTMRQRWHGSDRNVVGGGLDDRVGGGCWVVVVRLLGVHQDTVDVAVEV